MPVKNDETELIFKKAQEIGLICGLDEDNNYKIYIKSDYILSTTEVKNYWLLSFQDNCDMYLSNWEILEMLKIVIE